MEIVRRGVELTRTIKNIGRLKEIIGVLAKNGFEEFILKTGIHNKIPNFVLPSSKFNTVIAERELGNFSEAIGYRLRKSFEELGPGFIKIGQILATREDIFDQGFIKQMTYLQDKVRGIPFGDALKVLKQSLPRPYKEIFSCLNPQAIGTASIGVVYEGELLTGEKVVVKIRRPEVLKSIEADIEIFYFIVSQLEKVSDEIKYLGLSRTVRDLGNSIFNELDFNREAINCRHLGEVYKRYDAEGLLHIPKIYDEYSSESVLVLERINGIPFNNQKLLLEQEPHLERKLNFALQIFIKGMFIDGFYHADIHGGNLFLLENGQIGLIDFGLCGSLTRKNAITIAIMLYSILNGNYENFVYELLDITDYSEIPDVASVVYDIKEGIYPFLGLSVTEINSPKLMKKITKILANHKIYLPKEWNLVFKAITTMDGLGKALGVKIQIFTILNNELKEVAGDALSRKRMAEEFFWLGRSLLSTMRIGPKHLNWFLKEFARKNYAIKLLHTGHEQDLKGLTNAIAFMGYCLLSGILFLSGILLLSNHKIDLFLTTEKLVGIIFGIAIGLFIVGLFQRRKK